MASPSRCSDLHHHRRQGGGAIPLGEYDRRCSSTGSSPSGCTGTAGRRDGLDDDHGRRHVRQGRGRPGGARERVAVCRQWRAGLHHSQCALHPRRRRIRRASESRGDDESTLAAEPLPEREPDEVVSYSTRADQALLYRLNGTATRCTRTDLAARAGFDAPILHGLCTYGFTGRALLHTACGSDPARFGAMRARFSKPTMPGDTLRISCGTSATACRGRTGSAPRRSAGDGDRRRPVPERGLKDGVTGGRRYTRRRFRPCG